MAHYLLAASSIPGHLTPMLEIGADLVRRGHDVAFLADRRYRDSIHLRGMRHHLLPSTATPRSHSAATLGPPLWRRFHNGRDDLTTVFIEPLAVQYRAVNRLLTEQRIDAMLCDIAFTGALPLLLSRSRRPRVVVCGVGPLMLSSRDTPPFGMAWRPQSRADYRRMNWVVSNVFFRDIQQRFDSSLRSVGVSKSPVFVTDWPVMADQILQLSIPELEYPRQDLPTTVTFAGPVLPRKSASGPSLRRHRCARTVVHVTQGTWDNSDVGQLLVPTVQALASRDDMSVVATTGRRGRSSLPISLPANAFVTDYIPYDELLPKVDVMVTNGGFGGVHHGLAHGIPMVVAGAASDKPEVAARVAYAGAGIDLRTAHPSRRALAEAVAHVLTDPSYRAEAHRIARKIQQYNVFNEVAAALHPARVDQSVGVAVAR